MKKCLFICMLMAIAIMLSSCGHNLGLVGIGTGWRVGNGEYGLSYGDGIFGTFVTKDGVQFKAELDSTTGFSYDPSSNTYKGIKSFEYSLPPQITGYAVDFANENPEVAKAYYEALVKYYEVKKDSAGVKAPLISDEKSNGSASQIADVLKQALEKAKKLVGKKETEEGENATFQCNGNCKYADLTGNKDIAYQLSIAMKLLSYNGYDRKFEDTNECYTTTLEHFITQLVAYEAEGHVRTPLLIKRVTVKNKVIEDLMYVLLNDEGKAIETNCPSCATLGEEPAK